MKHICAALLAVCFTFASGGLTGRPAIVDAQTAQTTLRLGIVPAVVCMQAYLAQDLGIFHKHGLDVQFTPMNNGVGTTAALLGGSLDIGFGDAVTVSAAHIRGVPLTFIAPGALETDQPQTLALLVKSEGPIHGAKDLTGKIVAVNALHSMSTVAISSWIDGNGGASKSVKFIEYPIPQMAAAVASGIVDAAFPPEPFVTSAVDAGERAMVLQKGTIKNYMLSGWVATSPWLAANPETAAKFIAALREVTEVANRRPVPADVAEIVSKYTKIPPPVIGHLLFIASFGLALDARQLQPLIDASAKYGVIDQSYAAGDVIYRVK